MQKNSDKFCCEHLLKAYSVVLADKEDMLMHEAACSLLWHFKGAKRFSVNKTTSGKYRFVLRLCFIRYVLAGNQVYL